MVIVGYLVEMFRRERMETRIQALSEMGRRKNEHPLVYYWYNRLLEAED